MGFMDSTLQLLVHVVLYMYFLYEKRRFPFALENDIKLK